MNNYNLGINQYLSDNNNIQFDLSSSLKKVAIYARVSTTEQAVEGYSIDEQLRLLKEWCDQHGYEVYKEYADRGISGKSIEGRPALKSLLEEAKQNKFDMVLVWKTNRLARNMLDLLKIDNMLQQSGISFRSYSETNLETETTSGKLQFQILGAISEFERNNIAENVKMGMISRAREGSWNGGQVLGYDNIEIPSENRKRKQSRLVINETEAQTVKRMFQLYIEGNGYKSIANTLNKQGHRSKKNNTFSINAIKTILTNPVYVGYIRYNVRRDWNTKRRNNINPQPIIQKGLHEPIISMETWDKAQLILKNRSEVPNRVHSGDFPLSGILKCPVCGAGMVLSRTNNKRKDGTKRILEYYACGAWKNKGTAACNSNTIRVDYANEYVLNKVAQFASSDLLIKDVVKKLNGDQKESSAPIQHEYQSLKKQLGSIQQKKDKVLGLYEDEVISKTDLIDRLGKLDVEMSLLKNRIQPLELQLGQSNTREIDFNMVKEVMNNFVSNYKEAITSEQRKQLLRLVIKEIRITDRKNIDTIQIQMNNEVVKHFTAKGEEKSSDDDFSSPFLVCFNI
ncbi:recombinase family protein [Bacillus luteolus]|uniref:Recombinase family protein n=1 Tax=Litchfieldia luteola TaxID=682179 RepID=A0ABR9QHA1_9BACI|nr:recombinase family protein [Cytobacillus luteolus]MBE4907867.1 recombinase family protein [Cytobacillus luteolus]MBP1943975.1 site-specific DNA recombinase [Cytobacillus luteolus]